MSVLYKALTRAARSRGAKSEAPGVESGIVVATSRRRGKTPRLVVLLVLLVLAAALGGTILFGDELNDLVASLFGPTPTPVATNRPPPRPAPPRPATPAANPSATSTPSTASPGIAPTPPPPAATAAAASPATPAGQPPAPAAVPAPPAVAQAAPAPVTPAPAGTPQQVASAASPPPAAAPAPITPVAPAAIAPAVPSAAASAAPAPVTPIQAVPDAKPAATAPTPSENLPAVLARLRQQSVKGALGSTVAINRSPSVAPPSDPDADSDSPAPSKPSKPGFQVSVLQPSQADRDATDQAYDLLLHGQYEQSLALYDTALKTSPKLLPALLGRATALHKLRRDGEARTGYQRVMTVDPENTEALVNMTALVAADQPVMAVRELRDLERAHPSFSPVPAGLAQILANQGDNQGALTEIGRAVGMSPDNGLYRFDLAVIQDRMGMAREAARSYQAALDRLGGGADLPMPMDQLRARMRYLASQ